MEVNEINKPGTEEIKWKRKKYRWLYTLEGWLEAPMFVLAIVWLYLLVKEFIAGLSVFEDRLILGIWIAFIFEFALKLFLAPRKLMYIKRNWITVISLVVPAFRAFRILRAIRLLQASRVTSTTRIVRSLTSASRFARDLKEAQGEKEEGEVNIGVLISHSRHTEKQDLEDFVTQLIADVKPEMESATGIKWLFHQTDHVNLESDKPKVASEFLDEASMRMAEGPFDMIVVITDVALMSRKKQVETGLASRVSNVVVVSTRRLITWSRGKALRRLNSDNVRFNAATLLLHLLGRLAGLDRKNAVESKIMAPYLFQDARTSIQKFNSSEKRILKKHADGLPERELHGGNSLETLIFHILMAFKHPFRILAPLWRNKAPFLSLSLPGLATAAVAPTLLLVFSAEIWDVGLNMSNRIVIIYTILSILGATVYLVNVQSLFFPRKEKRVLTEHLALANAVVFLTVLLVCIGLFVMLSGLMLLIEVYIFPEDLMSTWPTLENTSIMFPDKVRLAAFMGAIGVSTGSLAGGFESRTLIQHLALFSDKP